MTTDEQRRTSEDLFARPSILARVCAIALVCWMASVGACATDPDDGDVDETLRATYDGPSSLPLASARVDATGYTCPRGPWTTSIEQDGELLVITGATPNAYLGFPNAGNLKMEIGCDVVAALRALKGWSYALESLTVQGTAVLEWRDFALVSVRYKNYAGPRGGDGWAELRSAQLDLYGPYSGAVAIDSTVPASARQWSPCGEPHEVNLAARANLTGARAGDPTSFTFAVDGRTSFQLRFRAKRCMEAPVADADGL